jgi:hypothetical protein
LKYKTPTRKLGGVFSYISIKSILRLQAV